MVDDAGDVADLVGGGVGDVVNVLLCVPVSVSDFVVKKL